MSSKVMHRQLFFFNFMCYRFIYTPGCALLRNAVQGRQGVSAILRTCKPWRRGQRACQVMRWMEQCAYIAASRIGRSGHLLTGSLDSLAFAQPTRVGDIMYVTAQVRPSFLLSPALVVRLPGVCWTSQPLLSSPEPETSFM